MSNPAETSGVRQINHNARVMLATGQSHTLLASTLALRVQGPAETRLFITHAPEQGLAPVMPLLNGVSATVIGGTPDATANYTWTATLTYRTRARPDKSYLTRAVFSGTFAGGTLPPDFLRRARARITAGGGSGGAATTVVAGGDLAISVSATIRGQRLEGRWTGSCRILAQGGPTSASIQRYLAGRMNPAEAAILTRIVCAETHNLQFRTRENRATYSYAGEPVMNTGGDGGAGMMQVTNPRPGPGELWDWRVNLERAIEIFRSKPAAVSAYVAAVRERVGELLRGGGDDPVGRVNRHRRARGLQPLDQIIVPDFTAEQARDDQIRGYNGFPNPQSAPGQFGFRWHEFWLKVEGSPSRLVVAGERMVGSRRVADAVWERVPPARRPRRVDGTPFGEPNYVERVHRASCT